MRPNQYFYRKKFAQHFLLKHLTVLLALMASTCTAKASAYWLELNGGGPNGKAVTVSLIYGNIDDDGQRHRQTGRELALAGEFRFQLIDPSGKMFPMKLDLKQDCWETSFIPAKKGRYRILGINDSHPVIDRSNLGGENVLPIDYLIAEYNIEGTTAPVKPAQFLDLTASTRQNRVHITAFKEDKPAKKGTQLRTFNPENWERQLLVDENGMVNFSATQPGMYMIRQDVAVAQSGTYKGLNYTGIRYRCNYCLFIP